MSYQTIDDAGVEVTISDDGRSILYRTEGTGPRWQTWSSVPRWLAMLDEIPYEQAQRLMEAAHAGILAELQHP
jgi:hypothetical protein